MKRRGKQLLSLMLALLFLAPLLPLQAEALGGEDDPCPECGYSFWILDDEADPTCTADGDRVWRCGRCFAVFHETIPALGHIWDGGTVTREPTCTGTGTRTYTCSRCGETRTETISALGHDWNSGTVTKEPTCTEAGTRTYTCSRCGGTRTETIAALGHDWDSGVTLDQEGFSVAQTVTTCRRCGETRTEQMAFNMANFFGSLRNIPPEAEGAPPLVITQNPVGGSITREEGDSLTLTVAAEGGWGAYTYEWHCRSLDGGQETILSESTLGMGSDLSESWASAAKKWYETVGGTFGSDFNADWLQTVTDGAGGGSLLETGSLFNDDLTKTTEPEYEAAWGNCEYWVTVTDEAEHSVDSQHVTVYYRIRIGTEPRNVNWRTEATEEDAVYLECYAVDGSGDYSYLWYWDGDPGNIVDLYDRIPVVDLGYYRCTVTDRVTGDVVESQKALVYDEEPLQVASYSSPVALWPEEEWHVQAAVQNGRPPYICWWDVDGDPLTTVRVEDDEQGREVFEAVGTTPGIYTFHVTDDLGAEASVSTSRVAQCLTIGKQPESGTFPPAGYYDLDVTMAEGTPPFTYVMYWNGQQHVQRTTNDTTSGFRIYEPGVYSFKIIDSEGHYAVSNDAVWVNETFRFTDQTQSASITDPGKGAGLSVTVVGGKTPYAYEWLESNGSGGWRTYGDGESTFTARRPGFYACRVTDAEGNTIRTANIQVTYDGQAPLIITQPQNRTQLYEEERFTLSCHAVSGSGTAEDNRHLVYDWYRSDPYVVGDWTWVGSGKEFPGHLAGIYKCVVTDPSNGTYSTSRFAFVSQEMKITKIVLRTYDSYFNVVSEVITEFAIQLEGGVGPYTIQVWQCSNDDYPDVLYDTYTGLSMDNFPKPIGRVRTLEVLYGKTETGHTIIDVPSYMYYFVILDAWGDSIRSQVVTPNGDPYYQMGYATFY